MDPYEQTRRICAALPEVVEVPLETGIRMKAGSRVFLNVFEVADDVVIATLSADPEERPFLLASGHPFFPLREPNPRIGLVLDDETDWAEVAELVTESYRINAPKKLVAVLDARATD